jgi:hypothetical protein
MLLKYGLSRTLHPPLRTMAPVPAPPQLSHIHEETNNHGSSLTIHLLGDFYKDIKRVLARVTTVQRENTDKQRGAQMELTKIRGALVELLIARFSANTPALF